MIYGHLDTKVTKHITGKQNMLPLLRDAIEDTRDVYVTIDATSRRLQGRLARITSIRTQRVTVIAPDTVGRRREYSVETADVIAVRIERIENNETAIAEVMERKS